MKNQGFAGIADSDPLGLGIENDISRHGKAGGRIHVNMAVSRPCLDYRDRAVLYDGSDKACPSPGNQHVYILVQLHKRLGSRPVRILDQLQRLFRKACPCQTFF